MKRILSKKRRVDRLSHIGNPLESFTQTIICSLLRPYSYDMFCSIRMRMASHHGMQIEALSISMIRLKTNWIMGDSTAIFTINAI